MWNRALAVVLTLHVGASPVRSQEAPSDLQKALNLVEAFDDESERRVAWKAVGTVDQFFLLDDLITFEAEAAERGEPSRALEVARWIAKNLSEDHRDAGCRAILSDWQDPSPDRLAEHLRLVRARRELEALTTREAVRSRPAEIREALARSETLLENTEPSIASSRLMYQISKTASAIEVVPGSAWIGQLQSTGQWAHRSGWRRFEALLFAQMAVCLRRLGEYSKASAHHEKASKAWDELGMIGQRGSARRDAGVLAKMAGDYERALGLYELALEDARTKEDLIAELDLISRCSAMKSSLGRYEEALEQGEPLVERYWQLSRRENDPLRAGKLANLAVAASVNQAIFEYHLGKRDIAFERMERAREHFSASEPHDEFQLQLCEQWLIQMLIEKKEMDRAQSILDSLEPRLEQRSHVDSARRRLAFLRSLKAGMAAHRGEYRFALEELTDLLEDPDCDPEVRIDALVRTGMILMSLRQVPSAIRYLKRGLEACSIDSMRADLMLRIGLGLRALGREDEARERYIAAKEILARDGREASELEAEFEIAMLDASLGDEETARHRLKAVQERLEAPPDDPMRTRLGICLGIIELRSGRADAALAHFDSALPAASRMSLSLQSNLEGYRATAHLLLGNWGVAMRLARESTEGFLRLASGLGEELALEIRDSGAKSANVGLLAANEALKVCQDLDEVRDQAFWFMESARSLLLAETLLAPSAAGFEQSSPLENARRAWGEASNAVLAAHAQGDVATLGHRIDRQKQAYESFRKLLAIAQVKAPKSSISLPTLAANRMEVQAALPPRGALVIYQFSREHLFAMVLSSQRCELVDLGESAPIREHVRLFARAVAQPGSDPDVLGKLIHDEIWAPLQSSFEGCNRVWISPEQSLSELPFDALPVEASARPSRLIDRLSISCVPSATVGLLLATNGTGVDASANPGVVALGGVQYSGTRPMAVFRGDSDVERLSDLEHSAEEARRIAGLVGEGHSQLLIGEEASREHLARVLDDLPTRGKLLHLACHSVTRPGAPQLSGLVLANGDVLSLADIARLSVRFDVVALAACSTVGTEFRSGEGVIGLARAFLSAGANRVIATNWDIRDRASRRVMVEFARALLEEGLPPVEALRRAKLLLRNSDGRESHPAYWAPFVIWGALN
ncbi:MAG: CHAT domain-containing protein [Planctomycetota bacterium]